MNELRPGSEIIEPPVLDLKWLEDVPEASWDGLRREILSDASPILLRRRWRQSHAVYRPLLTLATAATVAFLLWITPELGGDRLTGVVAVDSAELLGEETLVEALDGDVSDTQFRLMITGRADPGALLAVAVSAGR